MASYASSSSSDFSSDEESDALAMGPSYDAASAPRVVEVETLEDPVEAEISPVDGAALLAALQTEGVADALLQALTPVLATTTYSYDAYTTALYYLSSLWREDASVATQRLLTSARVEIYRRFSTAFPLTPDMYREYIASVATAPQKLRLYEQAARDYWSVALAIDQLQLLAEYQDELPGVTWTTLHHAMEHALASVGHHFTSGHDVWKTVRELTTQHFDELRGDQNDAKEAALRALFVRQMRLPLQQNDLAMSEFRAWHEYNTLAAAATRDAAFREAEQFQQQVFAGAVLKKLNQFEERVRAALAGTPWKDATESETPEKVWTQYLRYAQFKLAPLMASSEEGVGYVVCLFERAVASVCLSSSLWSQYVAYVETTKPHELLLVAQRATRNVSFDSSFWIERLLAMESRGDSLNQITEMIETDLLSRATPPLMDSAHMARVLTSFCGSVRRLTNGDDDAVDVALKRCKNFVGATFGEDKTPQAALLTFEAQFFAFRIQSLGGATLKQQWLDVWQEILRIRGGEAEVWLSFYDEYRFVHASSTILAQELRSVVLSPAADAVQDYPQLILERWLAFELSVGDHASYVKVHQRYKNLVQRLQYQAPEQVVAAPPATQPAPQHEAREKTKKRKAEASTSESTKRQKANTTTQPNAAPEVKKTERFTNDYTVFVCNISKDATQDDLRGLFAHISTLTDVRLVVKERGTHVKSRGMAYVQFSDDAGVSAGLELNGTLVHGQPIKVERSIPPTGANSSGRANSKGKPSDDKSGKPTTTLYVGGLLPPERDPISEDQLKQALTELLGDEAVKQVLILTDRRGRPKDYGLVAMTDAKQVNLAIQKQHELQQKLGDQVTVQTSRLTIEQVVRNREEQKLATQKAKEERHSAKPAKSERAPKPNGAFHAKTAPHAKPHARVAAPAKPVASAASLMPRALRKKTASVEAKSETSSATATTAAAPKTNADFRKLFLS